MYNVKIGLKVFNFLPVLSKTAINQILIYVKHFLHQLIKLANN